MSVTGRFASLDRFNIANLHSYYRIFAFLFDLILRSLNRAFAGVGHVCRIELG